MRASSGRPSAARWIAAWLLWMGVLALHSHVPGSFSGLTPWGIPIERLVPIAAYAVLGALGVGALARLLPDGPRPLWGSLALLIGGIFGALDEYQKAFIKGTRPAMADWLTALLGSAIAVIVARVAWGRLARAWLALDPKRPPDGPRPS